MHGNPVLHHVAKRISAGNLEFAIYAFEQLGCKIIFRTEDEPWVMLAQSESGFRLQLTESQDKPVDGVKKLGSHLGFISKDPVDVIGAVEKWAGSKNINFEKGQWSDRELWFDLPDIFVDFVVEIMHESILED